MSSQRQQYKLAALRKGSALWIIVLIYLLATAAAALCVLLLASQPQPPALWWQLVWANVVATLVVYLGSLLTGNASCYDAYWSVAPPLLAIALAAAEEGMHVRQGLVLLVVWLWGFRLTANWAYGWQGFAQEDWRYRNLADTAGRFWWLLSLLGVHGFPTLMILLGSRALVPALATDGAPLGWLDGAALLTGLGAVYLCHVADQALHRFREQRTDASQLLVTGVWGHCRHPNYLGEIGFWVALYLFALAAGDDGWSWLGPVAMLLLFTGISIPMIERKLEAAKPAYPTYRASTPMLIPRCLPLRRQSS